MSAKTFDQLLENAEDQLWLGFERAKAKKHSGLKGRSREDTLAAFLEARLPARFGVTTGEAVDSGERRTGELDIVIFDRNLTAPLLSEPSSDLLPAEALLAVIEVKSKLTGAELKTCAVAAKKISELRPYGKPFLPPRTAGAPANDARQRCLYSVIAYESNLVRENWLATEWKRLEAAAQDQNVALNRIDRVMILDRGIIVPPTATGRTASDGRGMLREWFLHMSNFLVREADRRPPFDFQAYGRRSRNSGWKKLQ